MVANEDLSSMQYKIVYVDGNNGAKLRAAQGVGVLGVLNNKPQSGEHASVVVAGLTRCVAGGTVTAGSWITCSASGTGITVSSGEYILGKSITGVASGSNFQMLVQHNGYRG
jgi:hypothetical protein|tara:strand:- start:5397 stop:5732 length:336 start_codon:yes stop_codon:yes gene_type:complete